MDFYNPTLEDTIIICGTIAFAVSGALAAMQKRLDAFGVFIVAFVTAVGGGTLRDFLIGDLPVFWVTNGIYSLLIFIGSILAMFFSKWLSRLKVPLFLFDSIGLGFFTIIGIQKGIAYELSTGMCITLGTVTGCFGGISRDILLNNIPIIFRKEIYATACILGGLCYFMLNWMGWSSGIAELGSISLIVSIRIIAVKYNLALPRFY